jgi:TatD DNase family protein
MIDTHCHLTYDPLAGRIEDVLAKAAQAGVERMISVGTSPDDGRKAADLAARYPGIYSTAGIHPQEAAGWTDRAWVEDQLRGLLSVPRTVAIGEMGLDKHYAEPSQEDQRRVFAWQLELAASAPHPIVIHNREATEDVIGMIRDHGISGDRVVFHCFTGTRGELDAILELGAMVSFTGIVTFKNAKGLAACALAAPMDRIMVETDSPYLTPEPYRKVHPNEPCYVVWVARFLASQRGVDEGFLVKGLDANAERFFRLPARGL